MATKKQRRQISANEQVRRIEKLTVLLKRFRLKKLAAGGVLASVFFLAGGLPPLTSVEVFAGTPGYISGTNTTGYNGADAGNSLLLNIEGGSELKAKEDGNTYYQNLLKVNGEGNLTLTGVGTGEGDTFRAKYLAIVTNTDQVQVNGNLTLNQGGYIGVPTDVDISATKAHADGTGYSVGSVYVGGGNLTMKGGNTTAACSCIYAGDVVVEGKKVTGDNPELIGGNVTLGQNATITTTGSFWANSSNNYSGTFATITLDTSSTLDVGGTLTFRDIVNDGGTVHARGNATGNTVTINSGTVNFYDYATISGRDNKGITNNANLVAYNGLKVGLTFTNNFKADLYGETVIEGTLTNNGKKIGETWVPAELFTDGNTCVKLKPNYANEINNSGIWTSIGDITSEASLKNTGTLTTTGSMSFSEKFDQSSLRCYENGTGQESKFAAFVKVTADNSGTLDVGGALTSTTGFTNSGTVTIGSNVDIIGALNNTNSLTTGGSVNLSNQIELVNRLTDADKKKYIETDEVITQEGARTVAYMGTKDIGRNVGGKPNLATGASYYWAVEEYLVGNVTNSGEWTANGSISTMASVNNSGTLNVTRNLVTTQDNTVYTVQNYQNTSGQNHLQASESLSGVFDSKITNTGKLNVSGYVTAAGGFENSGTATIGGALDVTGALTNASGATLTTDGKVTAVSGDIRDVLTLDSEKKPVTFTTQEAYMTGSGTVDYKPKTENLKVDNWTLKENVALDATIENNGTWNANGGIEAKDVAVTNKGTLNLGNDTSIKSYEQTGDTASTKTKGDFVIAGTDAETALKLSGGKFVADGTVTVESNGVENAADATFRSTADVTGNLTNKAAGQLTTEGMVTVDGSIANEGQWSADGNIKGNELNNTGTLNLKNNLSVTSDAVNDGTIEGKSLTANAQIGGDLKSSADDKTGTIKGLAALNVNGSVKNQNITGNGLNAVLTVSGEDGISGNGKVADFNELNVAKSLSGSVVLDNIRYVNIGGDVKDTVSGTSIYQMIVKGDVTTNGTISSDGSYDSLFQAKSITNTGNIQNFSQVIVTDGMQNGKDGNVEVKEDMNAEKSIENKGTISVGGNLVVADANGTVTNDEGARLNVYGDLRDAGSMTNKGEMNLTNTATVTGNIENGKNASITGLTDNSSLQTAGSITNSGSITNMTSISAKNTLDNSGTITGTGTGSVLTVKDNLKNTKTIENYETIEAGIVNISQTGTITGTGEGAQFKSQALYGEAGTSNFNGTITNFSVVKNEADLANAGTISGSGTYSQFNQKGNLNNTNKIENFQTVNLGSTSANTTTNTGTIAGTGSHSVLNQTGSLTNNGTIENFQDVNVSEKLTNAASLTVDGTVKAGSLDNEAAGTLYVSDNVKVNGKIDNKGTLTADGKVNAESLDNSKTLITEGNVKVAKAAVNSGTWDADGNIQSETLNNTGNLNLKNMLTVSSDVTNSGTILGMTPNANARIDGNLTSSTRGTISALSALAVNGHVTNQDITMANDNAVVEAGSLTDTNVTTAGSLNVKGDIAGTSQLLNVRSVNIGGDVKDSVSILNVGSMVAGNVNTTGTISSDGSANSSFEAKNVTNSTSIGDFSKFTAQADVDNSGTITGMGKNSTFNAASVSNNTGSITDYQTVEVTGEMNNKGTLTGTGEGSSLSAGTLNNDSTVSDYQTVSAEKLVNDGTLTGTGEESRLIAGSMENKADKEISGFQELTAAQKAVNAGTIAGTGTGSKYTFNGGLDNTGEKALISDVDSIIVNGDMNNSGALGVLSEMAVNDGTFTNEDGTLNLTVNKGDVSKITVSSGDAVINGGNVNVTGEQVVAGKDYVFLTTDDAHSLTVNTELDFSNAAPKLFEAKGAYDLNKYWFTLGRTHTYGDREGLTPNQRSTGKFVDKLAYMIDTTDSSYEDSDLFKVLEALDDADDAGADTPNNLDQLSGANYANQGMMGLQNTWFAHQNLANFVRPMDCSFTFPEEAGQRNHNVWGGFVFNTGNVKTDENALAHTYDAAGVIAGTDLIRTDNFRGGAYFQYQNVGMTERGISANTKSDHYDLGLYGMYEREFGYVLASGNISYGDYKADRYIAFGGENAQIARSHESDRGSFQQSMRLEAAPTFLFGEGQYFHPFAGLTYIHMNMEDLLESGADQYATAIYSKGGDLNSLRPEVGARINSCFHTEQYVLGLNARASWVHEFCDKQTVIENQFGTSSASYYVAGTDMGRDYVWTGVGLTADTISNWSFFGGYDLLVNNRATVHTGNMGVAYNW